MNPIRPDALDALLEATHDELRLAGENQGVWDRLVCTCGRPGCEIHDPARHTVTLQLDALAAWWRPEDATPEACHRLAAALRRLGDVLRLWEEGAPPEEDAGHLVHALRDRWLAGMGTPLGGPPGDAWMRDLSLVEARNALLLEKLLAAVAAAPFARLADAGAAHGRQGRARAAREGNAACRRALRAWMDGHDALPQRTLLQEHLLVLVRESGWSAGEAQDVARMAEDASHAVLAFGIADDLWVRAAYGAMEQVAPFAGLRVALILEDDPTAVSPPAAAAGRR